MRDLQLKNWNTAISKVRDLANQEVTFRGQDLEFSYEDLETLERHYFTFHGVLGFRYQAALNSKRIQNLFIVEDSAWIRDMEREPYRTTALDPAVHYMIDSRDGQLEVVAVEAPTYQSTLE